MIRILVSIFAILGATALVVARRGADETIETVSYPEGFREWFHVEAGYVGEGSPAYPRFGGIHDIYANAKAREGYRQRLFQDRSVLVFDVHEAKLNPGSIEPGTRRQLDVMQKRKGQWSFVEFAGSSRQEKSVTEAQGIRACMQCHQKAATDHVFSSISD